MTLPELIAYNYADPSTAGHRATIARIYRGSIAHFASNGRRASWKNWSTTYPRIDGEHAYYAVNGWDLSPVKEGIPGRGPASVRDDVAGLRIDCHQRAYMLRDAYARMIHLPAADPDQEDRWSAERRATIAAAARMEIAGNQDGRPVRRRAYNLARLDPLAA